MDKIICLEGPDLTGKTTLAKVIKAAGRKPYYHFTKDHGFADYFPNLTGMGFYPAVLDRFFLSEKPYAATLGRKYRFSSLEERNLLHTFLAQKPVLVLLAQKSPEEYRDDYLPENLWRLCMDNYLKAFTEWGLVQDRDYTLINDYFSRDPVDVASYLLNLERDLQQRHEWWLELWGRKCPSGGQTVSPQLFILADRLGPSNVHSLVFEAGPTARLMDELLNSIHIPLGEVYITNIIKDVRGVTRGVNKEDLTLLETELDRVKPKKVLLMGGIAKHGESLVKSAGIPYLHVEHLGALHRRGASPSDKARYFREVASYVTSISFESGYVVRPLEEREALS